MSEPVVTVTGGATAAGATVVVGCSGGADSMALLISCAAISRRRRGGLSPLRPIAVHVHHHLRPGADDDCAFVQSTCERWGVPVRVEHVHPADETGNLASTARSMREESNSERRRSASMPTPSRAAATCA